MILPIFVALTSLFSIKNITCAKSKSSTPSYEDPDNERKIKKDRILTNETPISDIYFSKEGEKQKCFVTLKGVENYNFQSISLMSTNEPHDNTKYVKECELSDIKWSGNKSNVDITFPLDCMTKYKKGQLYSIKFCYQENQGYVLFFTQSFCYDSETDKFVLQCSKKRWGWKSTVLVSIAGVVLVVLLGGLAYACFMRN